MIQIFSLKVICKMQLRYLRRKVKKVYFFFIVMSYGFDIRKI